MCACGEGGRVRGGGGGENLSAGYLKSHLTKIRTYHLFPSWRPSRSTNPQPHGCVRFCGLGFWYQ